MTPSSTGPRPGSPPTEANTSRYGRRDPWVVLESLLQSLTEASSTGKSIAATVEAVIEGVSADCAFWYAKSAHKVSAICGSRPMSGEWCVRIAQLVQQRTADDDVILWKNPAPIGIDEPTAAVVCRSLKSNGCIVAVAFDPERTFTEVDGKVARVALKVLLTQRTQSLAGTKQLLMGLLQSLTAIIDAKDPFTTGHSERVARIASLIAQQLNLSTGQTGDVYLAGLLHEVGNIGVRDDVLQKSGKLTREETEDIQQHPILGHRIVSSIKPFERLAAAVRHHHERYDGHGYPDRLGADEIPLLARVLGVADAVDAMMSPRRYRPGRSPIEIDAILSRESGKQFDPAVVKAFMAIRHEIYPPIYHKGLGESALYAIDHIVENMTDVSGVRLGKAGQ